MKEFNLTANQDGYTDGRVYGINSESIDEIFSSGIGSVYSGVTKAFYGISREHTGLIVPPNTDHQGYTFFTRPRMKLDDRNCILDPSRALVYLLNEKPLSVPRAIRAYLDPLGSGTPATMSAPDSSKPKIPKYPCPVVDPLNPFISILSNSLVSLTGWPDINVDTSDSQAGIQKEQWTVYDGISQYNGIFDLNASFTNMSGDPIGLMFHMWTTYGVLVTTDEQIIPWIDSIIDREKDYETCIYRLVMDKTKTYVQKIARTIVSIPTNSNTGASFDYDALKPINSKNDTVDISFKSTGAVYYDMYSAVCFNDIVISFNPNMHPINREKVYTKIPRHNLKYFRNEGYPRISLKTSELEWWVPKDRYKSVMSKV